MNRRKKAYFSLAVSFLLVIAEYVIILLLEMSSLPAAITAYVIQLLKVLAFIWINGRNLPTYNPTSRKVKLIVTALSVVAFVIAAMHLYLPGELSETDPILRFLSGPMLLEQYLIALICWLRSSSGPISDRRRPICSAWGYFCSVTPSI